MTERDARAIEQAAIDFYGGENQLEKAVEELGELIVAIQKLRTEKDPDEGQAGELIDHVAEEVADVEIMLDQIKLMMEDGEDAVGSWKVFKLLRLNKRMQEG